MVVLVEGMQNFGLAALLMQALEAAQAQGGHKPLIQNGWGHLVCGFHALQVCVLHLHFLFIAPWVNHTEAGHMICHFLKDVDVGAVLLGVAGSHLQPGMLPQCDCSSRRVVLLCNKV